MTDWVQSTWNKALTCSENSATSIKSRWNWAAVLQGLWGGRRRTENSSGRVWTSGSSPSSSNPPLPVKGSRSGEPIIFSRWRLSPWRIPPSTFTLRQQQERLGRTPPCRGVEPPQPGSLSVSQLFLLDNIITAGELQTSCAVIFGHGETWICQKLKQTETASYPLISCSLWRAKNFTVWKSRWS